MILERLAEDVVIGDGGVVFELERRGYVSAGPFTPVVVVEHPEALRQLQVDFARAGAEVLQAYTYYAHEEKLKVSDMGGAVSAINAVATQIAKEVADEYNCIVAGNICNTWVYEPGDPSSHAETRRQFDTQIEHQLPHGADFFVAETLQYLGEAEIALRAIHDAGAPAMITLGLAYSDRTADDVGLEEAAKRLEDAGAEIIGLNCFRDPSHMLPLLGRMREAASCHIAAQPVAFRCTDERPYFQAQQWQDGPAFPLSLDPFYLTRAEMADYALRAREMGIRFIGSCCGSAPHHVRAMAEALGRTTPNSKFSPRLDLHPIMGDESHRRERDQRILNEQRGEDIDWRSP
jgi:betaine-homocysteine S-methyltransferase